MENRARRCRDGLEVLKCAVMGVDNSDGSSPLLYTS
jgi:hypothetical protein